MFIVVISLARCSTHTSVSLSSFSLSHASLNSLILRSRHESVKQAHSAITIVQGNFTSKLKHWVEELATWLLEEIST
jgi:hypothetical protein